MTFKGSGFRRRPTKGGTMIHKTPHPKAGQTVVFMTGTQHPQFGDLSGKDFRLEDWWDRVSGGSWGSAVGNPACLIYAMRAATATDRNGSCGLPSDDEVVYGKVGAYGMLAHISEIETPVNKAARAESK